MGAFNETKASECVFTNPDKLDTLAWDTDCCVTGEGEAMEAEVLNNEGNKAFSTSTALQCNFDNPTKLLTCDWDIDNCYNCVKPYEAAIIYEGNPDDKKLYDYLDTLTKHSKQNYKEIALNSDNLYVERCNTDAYNPSLTVSFEYGLVASLSKITTSPILSNKVYVETKVLEGTDSYDRYYLDVPVNSYYFHNCFLLALTQLQEINSGERLSQITHSGEVPYFIPIPINYISILKLEYSSQLKWGFKSYFNNVANNVANNQNRIGVQKVSCTLLPIQYTTTKSGYSKNFLIPSDILSNSTYASTHACYRTTYISVGLLRVKPSTDRRSLVDEIPYTWSNNDTEQINNRPLDSVRIIDPQPISNETINLLSDVILSNSYPANQCFSLIIVDTSDINDLAYLVWVITCDNNSYICYDVRNTAYLNNNDILCTAGYYSQLNNISESGDIYYCYMYQGTCPATCFHYGSYYEHWEDEVHEGLLWLSTYCFNKTSFTLNSVSYDSIFCAYRNDTWTCSCHVYASYSNNTAEKWASLYSVQEALVLKESDVIFVRFFVPEDEYISTVIPLFKSSFPTMSDQAIIDIAELDNPPATFNVNNNYQSEECDFMIEIRFSRAGNDQAKATTIANIIFSTIITMSHIEIIPSQTLLFLKI